MIAAPRFQHVSSGGLALMVHGLFAVALVLSMSWKNLPQLPVEADLWAAWPEPVPPVEMEALPEPEPAPAPPPAVEPQPSEADIALRKAEEKEREKKRRAEEELLRQEEARKLDLARQQEEKRRAEDKARQAREEMERAEQAERERVERIKRDLARKQVEQEMAMQMQAELENEAAQMRAMQERTLRTERRDRMIDDYKRRIQAKVQSFVRLPQRIDGNPEAIFQVTLFANGEVRNVILVKSSGQAAYDVEVERAILKASPLPLPNDKEAAAAFRAGLTLKFRPYENGQGPRP